MKSSGGPRGWLLAVLSLFAVVVVSRPGPARAQATPQMQVQVGATTLGVGDVVRLRLNATSETVMPSDPSLGTVQGFSVHGQSAFPQQMFMNINGRSSNRYTLQVTWTLRAERVGAYRITPSAVVGGARYAAQPVTLTVVAAGQAPPQRQAPQSQFPPGMPDPFSFSPFDPWKGFMQGMDPFNAEPPPPPEVSLDPKLALSAARGAGYFLHATIDKENVVVGEAVTLSVYEYIDPEAGALDADPQSIRTPDVSPFVKRALKRDDQDPIPVGNGAAGGRAWRVNLRHRWALFPLRAGDLAIGPMSLTLTRPQSVAGVRASERLVVHVSEPPLAGRPAGYALGDVGRFSLAAQVKPREIEEGGAVAVHVDLSGVGNVPGTLATPARAGVEWLTPETSEDLGPREHDQFGGKRTFDYVVRLRRAGAVDLGEIALPFWNPDEKRYEVARVALGSVQVAPSQGMGAAADAPQETLPGLPGPRDALGGSRVQRAHLDDTPWFWILGLGVWPFAFGAAVSGRALGKRARAAWRSRRESPATELRDRVAAASTACEATDARNADAAIARALEAATVVHAGVSVRGALGGEVADRLQRAGVARDTAARVAELLRECEAARFAPDAADIASSRDRWERARGAIRGMESRG